MVSDITTSTRLDASASSGLPSVPTTNSPLEALSATVSVKVMSQSSMRESTISSAGSATSTASRTSSRVISSSVAGSMSRPSRKATSASTRGCSSGCHRDRRAVDAVADVHVVEQVAEVGLVDAELVLHGLRRRADLAADHGGPAGEPRLHETLLDGVRRGQVVGADQVAHRSARDAGLQRGAEALDGGRDGVLGGHETRILEPVTVSRHEHPSCPAEVDVVVVGAGGAGMTAALAAKKRGLDTILAREERLLRRLDRPQRRRRLDPGQLRAARRPARPTPIAESKRYLDSIVGDVVPKVRRDTYLDRGAEVLDFVKDNTPLRFTWVPDYADYHPEAPGGRLKGRSCEPIPLDARFLGDELDRLHPQYTKAPANMIVTQRDFRKISLGMRTIRGPITMVKVLLKRIISRRCAASRCTPWATRSRSACARA